MSHSNTRRQTYYQGNGGAYGNNLFAESDSTYYDGYQQAWRYLGWYVKCGLGTSDKDGSQDQHSQDNNDDDDNQEGYCQRYLMWAAYVDENYQGGGIGEYAYFDPYSSSWDYSACEVHGNGRCAPMDCHDPNTSTWKLMGVFKEASGFGDDHFLEQLFKHEGVCVWNDDEVYEFMSEAREDMWMEECVETEIQGDAYYFDTVYGGSNDYTLYLDLKPTMSGNMTYGLYTDSNCKNEYEGLDIDVEYVTSSMGLLSGSYLQSWNDALEIFKVCQPCRAYNLLQDQDSDRRRGRRQLDEDDPNEGYFDCDDDAGYTNVNQCMKFRSHADLEVATWEDLATATNQGGILQVNVGGTIFGSEWMSVEQAKDYYYNLGMERQQIAIKAKKMAQLDAEVTMMESEAQLWQNQGWLVIGMGSGLLLLAFYRQMSRKICQKRDRDDRFDQPLLH